MGLAGPVLVRHHEIDRKAADDAPLAQLLGDLHAGRVDLAPVVCRGGEAAAEEGLAGTAAEHLVMGRYQFDLAERIDSELCRGRVLAGAVHPLLDDALRFRELAAVVLPAFAARLEAKRRGQALVDPALQRRRVPRRRPVEVEHGIALAGEALVELHDRAPERRPAELQRGQRLDNVAGVAKALRAVGETDAGGPKHATRAALAPQSDQCRVAGIQRDAEAHRQRPLERTRIEHRQVGDRRVADLLEQSSQQGRAIEDLGGQGRQRVIAGAHQYQTPTRVRGGHVAQQAQVVLHDGGIQWPAGQQDEARAGHPQQTEHAQVALLVVERAANPRQLLGIEAQARNDYDRARRERVAAGGPEKSGQPGLKLGKACQFPGRSWLEEPGHRSPNATLQPESIRAGRCPRRCMPKTGRIVAQAADRRLGARVATAAFLAARRLSRRAS